MDIGARRIMDAMGFAALMVLIIAGFSTAAIL
jgi:hypothetical protein